MPLQQYYDANDEAMRAMAQSIADAEEMFQAHIAWQVCLSVSAAESVSVACVCTQTTQPMHKTQVRNASITSELCREYSLPYFLQPHAAHCAFVSNNSASQYFFVARQFGQGREPHLDYR